MALLLSLGPWGAIWLLAEDGAWPIILLQPLRVLLAAAGEGVDKDGQQHNQLLAQEDVLLDR